MRLTIGLPFYNARSYLVDALRSVFAQRLHDWELILVDDGSTDGSLEIARCVRDPRVTVHSDGINRGLPYRLNQIAQWARGEYLARMDADDMMHPDRLEAQVNFLDAHPNVDIVDTAMYSMDQGGRLAGVRGREELRATARAALRRGMLQHATVMGRTAWFRANPYDPTALRAEDYELWCRTVERSTFGRIPRPLYYCREGGGNLQKYLRSSRTCIAVIRRYGPKVLGPWRTWKHMAVPWIKGEVYRLLIPLHADRLLIALRNKRLDPADAEAACRGLRRIASTPVPGWDEAVARFAPAVADAGVLSV